MAESTTKIYQYQVLINPLDQIKDFQSLGTEGKMKWFDIEHRAYKDLKVILTKIFDKSNYQKSGRYFNEGMTSIMDFLFIQQSPDLALNYLEILYSVIFTTCAIHCGQFYWMHDSIAEEILDILHAYHWEYRGFREQFEVEY